MRRFRGGYTIIEVMIVLAITGALFGTAVMVFQGQQAKTSISQTMYDFSSKLQSYVNEVNSGIYNGSKAYSCSVSAGKATLSVSTGSLGSDQDCVFVGRAVQLIPNSSVVYVYTVIGNRDVYNGGNDTGVASQSLTDASPLIANVNGSMVLVDKYNFPSDITFSSAKATASDGSTLSGYGDLVGLYQDLAGSGAGTNFEAVGFPFPQSAGQNTPYSTAMSSCISLGGACASSSDGYSGTGYRRLSNWSVCVQAGGAKAEVKVKTSSAGITTEVDSQSCS